MGIHKNAEFGHEEERSISRMEDSESEYYSATETKFSFQPLAKK